MNNGPRVSVVLPVFNGEAFLREAIDSVLNQSFRDFEFLIIDDGSHDRSRMILQKFKDERLKLCKHSHNKGLFRTLNCAIRQARGELIKLWAQDDIMKPSCLAEFVRFMDLHPTVGMAYSACDRIDTNGNLINAQSLDSTPEEISPNVAAQIMFYHGSIAGNISNVLIRQSALERVGLFREDLLVSGDFEMWVRLSSHYSLGFLRQPLIFLRNHQGQFSRRKGIYSQFMKEDFEIIQDLKNRLPKSLMGHALKYDRRHRQLQYVHHLVGSLLARDWSEARSTYTELRRFGRLPGLMLMWLLTLDQRLFRLKPQYVDF